FSCQAGEFLEMQAQRCRPCAAGTFSLGTGVRFDEWDELPHGFANVATSLELGDGDTTGNCSGGRWHWNVALGCDTEILGCDTGMWHRDTGMWAPQKGQESQTEPSKPTTTKTSGCTNTHQPLPVVELSRGNNVLYWRTTAFSVWSRVPKPVLLRNIAITGVAFTSECFPCKPGTFSAAAGSASCQPCPADTFSGKGATACQPCDRDTYAEPGSGSCKPRPPCTDKDYFSTHTACDSSGQTQVMYKWAEPKICSEELPGAARLPPSGVRSRCPPCNPGFAKGGGSSCQPCARGS
ncbi:K1324 protein, partial [Pitta sordida]|nr:K1324 protein [Pitta sordida]